ncbi:MAG: GNAT family N-acetyltransferase [Oscillospiraceae bacterium]|nr:GNAT family N-acetyltransferase [Oscillospiraceae bacterium]
MPSKFTQTQLSDAHNALQSTLHKCQKIDLTKQAPAQRTLLERRIAALKIALALTEKEQHTMAERSSTAYEICSIDAALREKIQPILDATWGAPYIAVNNKLWDSRIMPGFAAVQGDEVLGYLLYELHSGLCEIMVLESVVQNIGIATALIEQVKQAAKEHDVCKLIVQTSNDNTHAFRFYQRRGFVLREIRLRAMDTARQLKPSIPLAGEDGIALRDEIEFELEL